MPARKIARSVHEAARDKAHAIAKTEAYAVSRRERKKVEMLFAHLKRILGLDRLRLRGQRRQGRVPIGCYGPKSAENSRSSSPRRRSSPPEAERPGFASLTAAPNAERRRHNKGFFNGIDPKRKFSLRSTIAWFRRQTGRLTLP